MSVEITKVTPWLAAFFIAAIGIGYFVFLYATWHQFQADQVTRQSTIDSILDQLHKAAPNNERTAD